MVKKPAFSKKEKELEREMKRSKRTEPRHQILELNFEVSEGESLQTPTEKGTQTDSKLFVDTCTQYNRKSLITCSTHLTFKTLIQPPFDQLEFQNDNEKVKFYIGFIIHESVMFQQAQLAIPAFNKGNHQLDLVDVKKTRGITGNIYTSSTPQPAPHPHPPPPQRWVEVGR